MAKLTQKDTILEAKLIATRIKSIASRLEYDARDYGVDFPLEYARELKEMADNFLKGKRQYS